MGCVSHQNIGGLGHCFTIQGDRTHHSQIYSVDLNQSNYIMLKTIVKTVQPIVQQYELENTSLSAPQKRSKKTSEGTTTTTTCYDSMTFTSGHVSGIVKVKVKASQTHRMRSFWILNTVSCTIPRSPLKKTCPVAWRGKYLLHAVSFYLHILYSHCMCCPSTASNYRFSQLQV